MKKAISAILTLIIALSLIVPVNADNETVDKYSMHANVLTALGIVDYEINDEIYDKLISRGTFIKMAVNFMSDDVSEYAYVTNNFKDVAPDKDYFAAVNCAISNGIISETENFYPDRYIDYTEAAEILVRLTGYSAFVTDNNYAKKASELKITSGLNVRNGITYGDAISMLYNCLDVDMPEKDSFSTNGYKLKYEKKAIEYYRGIKRSTGIVNQIYFCAVNGVEKFGLVQDEIVIGNEVYKCSYTQPEDVFGCNTEFWYTTDDVVNTILYIGEYKNRRIKVQSDDFSKHTGSNFTYYEGSRQKYIKISGNVDVIYNWSYCADYTSDDILLTGLTGNDVFIDNNDDGIYDVIIINEYKDYTISGIDAESKKIYAGNPSAVIDGAKCDNMIIIDAEKGEIDLSALGTEGIITVQQSKANALKPFIRVYCSNNVKAGTVLNWSEEDHEVEIDGEIYKVNSNVVSGIYPGNMGNFYIDYFGYIGYADYKGREFGKTYGFLMRLWLDEDSEEVNAKIINEDGQIGTYKFNGKVTLDGIRQKARNAYAKFLTTAGILERQVIVYRLSQDGAINEIDTKTHESGEDDNSELKVMQYSNVSWQRSTATKTNCLNGRYAFTRDAKIFIVPDISGNESLQDEDCRVLNTYDVPKKGSRVKMDIVNPDDAGMADMGVYYYPKNTDEKIGGDTEYQVYKNTGYYMVYSVRNELNEDDEVKPVLYYFANGIICSAMVENENVIKKPIYKKSLADGETDWIERNSDGTPKYKLVQRGDIIQFKTDDRGIITAATVINDYERVDNGRFVSHKNYENASNESYDYDFGIVYTKAGNGISVVAKLKDDAQLYDPNDPEKTFDIVEHPSNADWKPYDFKDTNDLQALRRMTVHNIRWTNPVIVYDSDSKEIRYGSYADIVDYKTAGKNPTLALVRTSAMYRRIFIYK